MSWLSSGPAQGQQPTPDPAAPVVQTTVAAKPNPDGTYRVQYQFPLPPRTRLVGRPVARVLNVKGNLAGLLPLLIFRRGATLAGFGDFRLPKGDRSPFRVQVEVDYERPNGSKGRVVAAKALAKP